MVRLGRVAPDCGAELVGKLEAYNPAGSVKDRIGVAMIDAAEAAGRDRARAAPRSWSPPPATPGIALAFVCAARGYELVLTMPQGMSREREKLVRLYGAEVRARGVAGRHERGGGRGAAHRSRAAATPSSRTSSRTRPTPRSTGAPPPRRSGATWRAGWTCWWPAWAPAARSPAAASGSRSCNPDLHVVAVEPRSSAVLSGGSPGPHKIQGIGAGFVPAVLNREVIDEVVTVDDEDAIGTARLCARREGVLAGISVRRRAVGRDRGRLPSGDAREAGGRDHARLG